MELRYRNFKESDITLLEDFTDRVVINSLAINADIEITVKKLKTSKHKVGKVVSKYNITSMDLKRMNSEYKQLKRQKSGNNNKHKEST